MPTERAEAIVVFRREDRTALPLTDTTGVLIGIVTVDDAVSPIRMVLRGTLL